MNTKRGINKLMCTRLMMVTALLLFLSLQTIFAQQWQHRVQDDAGILSQSTIDYLEGLLKAHEDSTTNQIAIRIIPSLEGKVLEEYSMRLAYEELKLGSSKNDNGVLLLIAVDDHKMRIEVGEGLEGVLTDALSSRIIRNEIAPAFRQEDYDGGVTAGARSIIKAIKGEYTVADKADETHELDLVGKLIIGAFLILVLGIFTTVGLIVPGGVGWFLYIFLIPFYAIFPMIVLGGIGGTILLTLYLVGFPIGKRMIRKSPFGQKLAAKNISKKNDDDSSSGSGGSGWFSGSSWSSGSSSGWSGGSGGFSGGGGSFGGGGSSGSW